MGYIALGAMIIFGLGLAGSKVFSYKIMIALTLFFLPVIFLEPILIPYSDLATFTEIIALWSGWLAGGGAYLRLGGLKKL